jgi:hypothetical protein
MTTKVSESLNDALPGSVSKFTGPQLAMAFVRIMKDPRVAKTIIPHDVQALRADIRKMLYWKIDYRYNTITGIDNLNRALVRIMCYSIKPQVKKVESQGTVKQHTVIVELEKQLAVLRTGEQSDQTKKLIETKTQMIEKLKAKSAQIVEEDKEEFTSEKMASVAKRVYDIMIDQNRSYIMHEEIEFLMKPKVDHVKEGMGGDYILPNSDRDRKFKIDGKPNWLEHKTYQVSSHSHDQSHGSRSSNVRSDTMENWRDKPRNGPNPKESGKSKYFAPVNRDDMQRSDTGVQQRSDTGVQQHRSNNAKHSPSSSSSPHTDTQSTPVKYVPPVFCSDRFDNRQEKQYTAPQKSPECQKKDVYVPPHLKSRMTDGFSEPDAHQRSDSRSNGRRRGGDGDGDGGGDQASGRRYGGDRNGGNHNGGDRGDRHAHAHAEHRAASFVSIDQIRSMVDVTSVTDFPTLGEQRVCTNVFKLQSEEKHHPMVGVESANLKLNKYTLLQVDDENDEYDYGTWEKDNGHKKQNTTTTSDSINFTQNGKTFAAIAKEAAAKSTSTSQRIIRSKPKQIKNDTWDTIINNDVLEDMTRTMPKLQSSVAAKSAALLKKPYYKDSPNGEDEEDGNGNDDWGKDGVDVNDGDDVDDDYDDWGKNCAHDSYYDGESTAM